MNGVFINPPAAITISLGSLATSSPLALITSSPENAAVPGLIKSLIAAACLASTETIFPASTKYAGLEIYLPAAL